jgi:hypothetical protein
LNRGSGQTLPAPLGGAGAGLSRQPLGALLNVIGYCNEEKNATRLDIHIIGNNFWGNNFNIPSDE